jgi:anti-sigma factor RsiW
MTARPQQTTQLLLQAYMDGELDTASKLAFGKHLGAERDLAAVRARLLALRGLLRDGLPPKTASTKLLAAMVAIAGAMPKSEPGAPPGRLVTAPTTPSWRFAWGLAVTACFVGAYSGGALTAFALAARAQRPVMAEVVADQQNVKPWFTGRLPFAPQVFDLTQAGFTLAGGRADVLAGQPSSTLVYRHGKHLISLLSQPVGSTARKSHEGNRR